MPAHLRPLKPFSAHARIEGDCGDTMEIWLDLEGGAVQRASFTTDGCETSVAVNLAMGFAFEGFRTEGHDLLPVQIGGLKVMSLGFARGVRGEIHLDPAFEEGLKGLEEFSHDR